MNFTLIAPFAVQPDLPNPVPPFVRFTIRNSPVTSGYLILSCPEKHRDI